MITIKKKIYNNKIKENDLVLDIETTGLDFKIDKLVLLGLVKLINNKVYIIQYFAQTDREEIRLLKIFQREIQNKRIITYNGDTFDIGFLNSRLINHELSPVFPDESLDIYKIVKANSKFIFHQSMKLIDIEKLIGINRDDPTRYKTISKLTEDIKIRNNPYPILKHNENDLISTASLINIKEIYREKLSIKTKFGRLFITNAIINKDIGEFIFVTENDLNEAFIVKDNYQLVVKNKIIKLNLHVLFGNFDKENFGYVAINTLKIPNSTKLNINENLLIIQENFLYSYKNLLNLCKKIIEDIS